MATRPVLTRGVVGVTTANDYIDERSQFATIDGLRVHFKREGHGAAILLLHGSGSSLHTFDEVVRCLTPTFELVRLDLPGFGLTGPRSDRDYRILTYVSFVDRFMTALSIERFSIAGNSLGGNIAWNFALDHPDRIQALVLMNATGYPEKSLPAAMRLARKPLMRSILRRWGPRSATEKGLRGAVGPRTTRIDDAMVNRVHAMISRPGNRSAFVDFANTDQADRSREILRIKAPTLILRGDLVDGQYFARGIPDSVEIVYKGIGHLLPDEIPAEVADAIRSHVSRANSAGRL